MHGNSHAVTTAAVLIEVERMHRTVTNASQAVSHKTIGHATVHLGVCT